jgi:hypothetical protein
MQHGAMARGQPRLDTAALGLDVPQRGGAAPVANLADLVEARLPTRERIPEDASFHACWIRQWTTVHLGLREGRPPLPRLHFSQSASSTLD